VRGAKSAPAPSKSVSASHREERPREDRGDRGDRGGRGSRGGRGRGRGSGSEGGFRERAPRYSEEGVAGMAYCLTICHDLL
jgi:hypothetical protein